MKNLKLVALLVVITTFTFCGQSGGKKSPGKKDFESIESKIKSKFGKEAYLTDFTMTHNESIGNIVNITVTKKPESFKMEEWSFIQGKWNQESDITVEIPEGFKAADFMYQLADEISLSELGELVEDASKKLKEDKKINPKLHVASIDYPNDGDISKAEYIIMLKPETGGTTFTYSYNVNGEFIEMDY